MVDISQQIFGSSSHLGFLSTPSFCSSFQKEILVMYFLAPAWRPCARTPEHVNRPAAIITDFVVAQTQRCDGLILFQSLTQIPDPTTDA